MAFNNPRVLLKVFISLIWLTISSGDSMDSLTSIPSPINGILTACSGDEISLTCNRDNVGIGTTLWNISAPVNCSQVINHARTSFDNLNLTCGSFAFYNVTSLVKTPSQLSSTAVATAIASMSGSVVECREGNLVNSTLIDKVLLCIYENVPGPTNLQCNHTQSGLTVAWDSGSVGNSCAEDSSNYNVTVVNESNGMVVLFSLISIEQNKLDIINDKLERNQNYSISIELKASRCSNESELVFSACKSLDDSKPASMDSISSTDIGVVIFVIILIIAVIAFISVLIAVLYKYKKLGCDRCRNPKHSSDIDSKHSQSIDLTRQPGSSGELNTDVKKDDSELEPHPQSIDPDPLTPQPRPSRELQTDVSKLKKDDSDLEPITIKRNDAYEGQVFKNTPLDSKEKLDSNENVEALSSMEKDENSHVNGAMTVNATTIDAEAKEDNRPPKPIRISKAKDYPINCESSSEYPQYVDPDALTHTRAPGGALYTDIDRVDKNKLPAKYQKFKDPGDSEINYVDENKDQDTNGAMTVDAATIDAEAKEDNRPPKPIRISKANGYPIISEESSSKQSQYVDPDALTHTRAPDGALYTDIDGVDKKNLPAKRQEFENPGDSEIVDESKAQDVNSAMTEDATTINAEAKEEESAPKPSKAKYNSMYEEIF